MKINPVKAKNLSGLGQIKHGFFSRAGGKSSGVFGTLNCKITTNDSKKNVEENRLIAMKKLNLLQSKLCLSKQIHGNRVEIISKTFKNNIEADGLVTKTPGLALGVLSADCAPLLIADKKKKIVGAAHCGWRGSLNGIIEEIIKKMIETGSKMHDLCAAIGPCIGPDSYEVGNDFIEEFKRKDNQSITFFKKTDYNKQLFNLPGYVQYRLENIGVRNIYNVNIDTYKNNNLYFSFRMSSHIGEKDFGCQLSVISIENC